MSQNNPTSKDLTVITRGLCRVYKTGSIEVPALQDINLELPGGVFYAVKGRSGSGKTTLVNCIGGLDRPTSGMAQVLGQELTSMSDEALTTWRRANVGFVFQSFGLMPTFSASENVEIMLQIGGRPLSFRQERTSFCLHLVGLDKWRHHRPYEMSGGQQQRVAIGRAIANHPQLILADEPTGELDSTTAREILALFRSIVTEEKVTLLLVSHDPLVEEYADQILQLRDGRLFEN